MQAFRTPLAAVALIVAVAAGLLASPPAHAACRIEARAEMKVEPGTLRPVVKGEIDKQPVTALLDTGAWATTLTTSAADRLGLRPTGSPVRSYGAGGALTTRTATVTGLRLSGLKATKMLLPVSGSADVDMLVGDDIFNDYDVELDLKAGVVRLLELTGCSDDEAPYWSKGAYVMAPLLGSGNTPTQHYTVMVKLNGRPTEAIIDSGASATVVTPAAARRAGARLDATQAGAFGLAGRRVAVSFATLDTFSIGDETIRNSRIEAADLFANVGWEELGSRIARGPSDTASMLLGADFLRSHHVLLSVKRGKAYITYEGGPVFAAEPASPKATPAPQASPRGATPPS